MLKSKFCCRIFNVVILFAAMQICTAQETENYTSAEEVCSLLSRYACMRGTFIQKKTIPSLKRDLSSSGTFVISADSGIIWNTQKPFPSLMVVSSDHISQSSADGTTARIETGSNRTFMEFSEAISAAFSGNITKIRAAFTADFKYTSESWTLSLRPKDTALQQFINVIELTGNSVLKKIIMTEQGGGIISYTLSNHTFSQDLTDDEQKLFAL